MAPRKVTPQTGNAPPKRQGTSADSARESLGDNISKVQDPAWVDDDEATQIGAAIIGHEDEPPVEAAPAPAMTLEQARAIIAAHEGVPAQPAPEPRRANVPPPANMPAGVKRVKIILEDNTDIPPTGLFIGYNGNTYMIKPSVEVMVPVPLLEILNNAVMAVAVVDPNFQRVVGYRRRLRFPYRMVQDLYDAAA